MSYDKTQWPFVEAHSSSHFPIKEIGAGELLGLRVYFDDSKPIGEEGLTVYLFDNQAAEAIGSGGTVRGALFVDLLQATNGPILIKGQ